MTKIFILLVFLISCNSNDDIQDIPQKVNINENTILEKESNYKIEIDSLRSEILKINQNSDKKVKTFNNKIDSLQNQIIDKQKENDKLNDKIKESILSKESAIVAAKADSYSLYSSNYRLTNKLLIFILIITIFISSISSLYLYKWRTSLKNGNALILPEDLDKLIRKLNTKVNSNSETVAKVGDSFKVGVEENKKKLQESIDIFLQMQNQIKIKEKEINRYKKGYDNSIYMKYLNRFITINEIIENLLLSPDEKVSKEKILKRLQIRFEDAFEDCNLEKWNPKINESYKNYETDDIEIGEEVKPEKEDDEYQIISIISNGYRLDKPDGYETIKKSTLKIYGHYEKK